ncbi:MAG: Gfo/Idh/MocA family oxidoreductase [Actinomycetota bacterium]
MTGGTVAVPGVALIGCGYWGKNVARSLASLGALVAVADTDLERSSALAQQFSVPAVPIDLVLENRDIAAVAIATPASTHHDLATRAMLAGKDVFVEKPMALEPAHAEAMISVADSTGRVLMVGHLLQYHPAFRTLLDHIAQGHLGRLHYVYSNRLNFGKIRREEDVLWSFAPHDLSMILALAGEEPSQVRIEGKFLLHDHIADVTTTHLTFPSGLAAHVFVSWLHPSKEQKLVVVGEEAMAVFDDIQPREQKLALYRSKVDWRGGVPTAAKAEPEYLEIPADEPLVNELRHFCERVVDRSAPRTDGIEGLRVLRVLAEAGRQLEAFRPQSPPSQAQPTERAQPNGQGPTSGPTDYRSAVQSAGQQQAVPVPAPPVIPVAPQAAASAAGPPTDTGAVPRSAPPTPLDGVHPTAVIDDGVLIGPGTRIWHFSHVLGNTTIGRNCSLGQNVVAGPNVTIGDGVKIQNNVSVYDGVTLEDEVFCGPSMVFTNVLTPRAFVSRKEEFSPTLVRRGASIGANATIVCGNTVGRYAMVAAGAVVTRDVPDYALVGGIPARQLGLRTRFA